MEILVPELSADTSILDVFFLQIRTTQEYSIQNIATEADIQGKSLIFELFIWVGYVVGMIGKFISHNISYVLIIYAINIIMVSIDIYLYFQNVRLDRQREAEQQ